MPQVAGLGRGLDALISSRAPLTAQVKPLVGGKACIYSLANQKGGVGKTTTAVSLAAFLALYGQRVLLVDLDPQANATSFLKVDKYSLQGSTYEALLGDGAALDYILHNPRLKISLLPGSPDLAGAQVDLVNVQGCERRLQNALAPLVDRYDYILIDCPPSLGLLTLNGLVAGRDGVIIPVQCEYLALEGLALLTETLDWVRSTLQSDLEVRGVALTMFDGRTKLARDVYAEVRRYFPGRIFKTIIPRSVRLAESPSYGQPISVYSPSSPGAQAYAALARELLEGDGIPIVERGTQ